MEGKKKKFLIGTGVIVAALVGTGGFFIVRGQASRQEGTTVTVQETTAEKGSISTTVSGTGTLSSAETVDVVVPTGIKIDKILVESGDEVKSGATLATVTHASVASQILEVEESIDAVEEDLEDSDLTTLEIEVLNGELSDLNAALAILNGLHSSLKITATADGVIGSVNVAEDEEVTKNSGTSSSGNTTTSASNVVGSASTSTSTSASVSGTSAVKSVSSLSSGMLVNCSSTTGSSESTTATDDSEEALNSESETINAASENSGNAVAGESDAIPEDTGETFSETTGTGEKNIEPTVVNNYENLSIPAPVTGEQCVTAIPAESTQAQGYRVSSITWDCTGGTFKSGTVYTATLELTALEGYTFVQSTTPVIACSTYRCMVEDSGSEKNKMVITATYEKTETKTENGKNSESGDTESTADSGTPEVSSDSSTESAAGSSGNTASGNSATGASANAGTTASGSTGTTGSGTTTGTTESTSSGSENTYSSYETAAFTVEKQDNVIVSLNVDELDILSVEKGQTASITLDAIEDQTFEGKITSVASSATTSGSSSKYTVEITVPKESDMRIGMSASATINISESEDAVLIPVLALQERGGSSFVYTEKDEEGNLSGEVEVETGLSDGSRVEIISGLDEGDTIYYLKAETSSGGEDSGMMPGRMNGDMPSGTMPSEMPSGGNFGGESGGRKGGMGQDQATGGN